MANSKITLIRGLNQVKNLSPSDNIDANDLYGNNNNGLYYLTDYIPNVPARYSILLVVENTQMLIGADIYFRARYGSPLAWGKWRKTTVTILDS